MAWIMINIYKCGLEKVEITCETVTMTIKKYLSNLSVTRVQWQWTHSWASLSVRCRYNDNEQIVKHSGHRQDEVIPFTIVIQRFVIINMIEHWVMVPMNYYKFGGKIVLKKLKLHCFYV